MKNLVKTFAIAALTAMNFVSNATDNGAIPAGVAPTKSKTFEVGMYQSVNTLKMNVMIEKSAGQNLTVTLKDEQGNVLYDEQLGKKSEKYHGKYDMSNLADGKYMFEFKKGDEKVVKEVNLFSAETINSRKIELD